MRHQILPKVKTGLYIHIPFCTQKCFFCSFIICVGRLHRVDEYFSCLSREAERYAGTAVDTVYIGGGTPTLLNEKQLVTLDAMIRKYFRLAGGGEYTIETNPDTLDLAKANVLRALGINRISIGAQTFDNTFLRFLGRSHRSKDILSSFAAARKAGFSNINLDLMFGFPRQSWKKLEYDLSRAVALQSEHLSFYSLTIDPQSRFYRTKPLLPSQEKWQELYTRTLAYLEGRLFSQYEISNFAKKGYASAHNTLYWECENYIGLGIGAHSHLDGRRFWNLCMLYPYLSRMKKKRSPVAGKERLGRQRRLMEALLFGLRMNQGVDILRLEQRFSAKLAAGKKEQIEKFVEQGFFLLDDDRLKTTLKGRLVLDELCGYLI